MRNYVKEGQKLPLFGVGPYIVYGMAGVTAAAVVLFNYVLKIGILSSLWIVVFRIIGGVLIVLGLVIWFIGAVGSGMSRNISENRLKIDGIYAWVRNPMYSGWWILIFGISLMWHNVFLLIPLIINWGIMTAVLKRTEEKWLLDLYGDEYSQYLKRVNRCIPWKRRRPS
ncbi:MAG: isoprenylcysteine carboxylmethyltransferase family protein [Fretibacterium sp.]|nr:isoprenylcysteine carboxylmethyltransferase family protein [Fretibacterium sp.]